MQNFTNMSECGLHAGGGAALACAKPLASQASLEPRAPPSELFHIIVEESETEVGVQCFFFFSFFCQTGHFSKKSTSEISTSQNSFAIHA
jgi:hypothetical protein